MNERERAQQVGEKLKETPGVEGIGEPEPVSRAALEQRAERASDRLKSGEIGQFGPGDLEVGEMVIDVGGDYPTKYALRVERVDEVGGKAYVSCGDRFGPKWVPIANLRDISAAMAEASGIDTNAVPGDRAPSEEQKPN